jgi:RimJ/RimL family protein N-acetyltransferase
MKPIETQRLVLRRWRSSDREAFYKMNSDPVVMEFMPKILARDESDGMMARMEEHFEKHHFGLFAVEEKESGVFIGFTGLSIPRFESHFTPCVEIGWRLDKAYWGKGYATEAALSVLAAGFDRLGLEEIVSFTSLLNQRSIAVMERLKMTRNPSDDFEHPALPEGHPLRKHILYRIMSLV